MACDVHQLEEDGRASSERQQLSGGIELTTNILRVTSRYTNQNPEILTLLASDPWRRGQAHAISTQPSGFRAETSNATIVSPQELRFEMLVEAGAGGAAGVAYRVETWRGPNQAPTLTNVTVRPPNQQPGPTEVTTESCIGVFQFRFGTDETCQTPVPVRDFRVNGFEAYRSGALYTGYVPAGWNYNTTITHYIDSSYGVVARSQQLHLSAGCDELVPVCIVVPPAPPPPPPSPLGGISGPFEIMGEPPTAPWTVYDFGGTSGGSRSFSSAVAAPISEPSRWWTLSPMHPGDYSMQGVAFVRRGRDLNRIWTPHHLMGPVPVVANQITPVTRVIDGQTRYPFVMNPAYLYGSVQLADPFVAANPGAISTLQSLMFAADFDSDGDGIPDIWFNLGTAIWALGGGGEVGTSFRHHFEPSQGALLSTYEQVLPSPYDLPLQWSQEPFRLYFWSETTPPFQTRPGLYDPAQFRFGMLDVTRADRIRLLVPGERSRIDHEYCFSDLQLHYSTPVARFFNPRVDVEGSFSGLDWQGRQTAYTARGQFHGVPAVWDYPSPETYAQPSGWVSLALAQGTYSLQPAAYMVNEHNEVNLATFSPISLTVGCGQRLRLVPPLTVAIAPTQSCTSSASATVSGVVTSSPAEVDRVWYRINGGPEVTLCTGCGINPTFSFIASLQDCQNTVQVFAFTEGMPEPASSSQQLVWDDAADGPSCPGTYCVNRPPVARCQSVVVPADAACRGLGLVNEGSYDPDEGDSASCVQTPGGSFGLGTHRVTLTCTDSEGLSSSCEATVTVKDMTPPQMECPAAVVVCGEAGVVAPYTASVTDNCGMAATVMCAPAPGAHLPEGTTVATCSAVDSEGNQAVCTAPVRIVPAEGLSLTLNGAQEMTLECGADTYVDPGAVALDGCGNLLEVHRYNSGQDDAGPGPNTAAEGNYSVQYIAWNAAGTTVSAIRSVRVEDRRPPSLNLRGPTHMTHTCGSQWVDPGVESTDACYGDVSPTVRRTGTVNGWAAGTYVVTYEVTDISGNSAPSVARTVEVANCPW